MDQPYSPKKDHPWRRYKVKRDENGHVVSTTSSVSLRKFLTSLIDNWDTYSIPVRDGAEYDYPKIRHMSDPRIAEWLDGMLKKHWVISSYSPELDVE